MALGNGRSAGKRMGIDCPRPGHLGAGAVNISRREATGATSAVVTLGGGPVALRALALAGFVLGLTGMMLRRHYAGSMLARRGLI